MSKKFGMRNALCTLMACGATMGGISAVTQSSTPVFAAETVSHSGGDFQLMSQAPVGRKRLRKTLNRLVEDKVMGGPLSKLQKSDNAETQGLMDALYRLTTEAAKKDCIAVNDEKIDTRYWWNLSRAYKDPDENTQVEFSFLEDTASVDAVKTNFPKLLNVATTCSNACNGLRDTPQNMSLVLTSIENFSYAMKKMDMQLRLLPNNVEYVNRGIIYERLITDNLTTSMIGKNVDLGLIKNENLKSYVQQVFDDMKTSWKERLDAVKQVVDARKDEGSKVNKNKKPKGNGPRNNSGKPRNNGKPRK